MENLKKFTNLYSKPITLRFSAEPIGNSGKNFRDKILQKDKDLDESYQEAKLIIDNYHRWHIDTVLRRTNLDENKLMEFYAIYTDKHYKDRDKLLASLQKGFRKVLSDSLLHNEKDLFGEKLITSLIPQWLELCGNKEALEVISKFNKFTTYFTGFNANRKNIYTEEEKKNSITYRLIHENLLKFIDNINLFERIKETEIANNFDTIKNEAKLNIQLEEVFTITYFNKLLTQSGIDLFNLIIGGYSTEKRVKYKGLNEYINEYNQTHAGNQLPKFRPLFKQILSEKDSTSYIDKQFADSKDVIIAVNQSYDAINSYVLPHITKVLGLITLDNLSLIYIENGVDVTRISSELCGNYDFIKQHFIKEFEQQRPRMSKETIEKYYEKINKAWSKDKFVSLEYINTILRQNNKEDIISYFTKERLATTLKKIEEAYKKCQSILTMDYEGELKSDKESVSLIKDLLDSIKELQLFIKPLSKGEFEPQKDDNFYNEFIPIYSVLNDNISHLYDRVRNYVTQKPYSTEKIKLNFENSTLMSGWDVNKEPDNTTIILRKDGFYYIGIMDKKSNKCFSSKNLPSEGECYEKMEYKLLPGANKMLPKVFFSKSRIEEFAPNPQLLRAYEKGTHKKGVGFRIEDCRNLIDFFKISIEKHNDWKQFNFRFSPTNSYQDISDFYREVEHQGYKITFRNISQSYIDALVAEGKLYLFRLYNKDFSQYSKGQPNLHTMYWKMLFDEDNLANVMYALNGGAELFFRPASLERKITHPANEPIACKSVENKGKASTFKYDLIKDKRYTQDTFQFHVPITLNFKGRGINTPKGFNEHINKYYLPHATHIIGIDRGERNLLYISVIDMNGRIVEQFSLNDIVNEYNGKQYHTDYHHKLDDREKARAKARESWQSIENVKELKEGYLSQVVHKIVQLVLKYNAIIVMEDLEKAFKNNRLKIEKSVYQKFEDALINKLSYIVDKTAGKENVCGLLNALQLAYIPQKKNDIINQCGIIFYIPAWCTSKIDPVTGFINKIDTRYTSIEKAKELIGKFADICYDDENECFEFKIEDYTKLGGIDDTRKDWVLTSRGMRIETVLNPTTQKYSEQVEINLTDEFMKLLQGGIGTNLKDYILHQDNSKFFKDLLRCIKLMLQMRNSKIGTDIDYLISPVKQDNGEFYSSKEEKQKGTDSCGQWKSTLPIDADANGAYNIARKGLMVANKLKSGSIPKEAFAVSSKDWLNFVQQNNV